MAKRENLTKKVRENPWIVSTLVLGILVFIILISNFSGGTGKVISGENAGEAFVDFINSRGGEKIDYVSYKDFGNLYEITVSSQGKEVPIHITKDGKYFVQIISSITDTKQSSQEPTNTDIPKSNKPVVELFVMTHCPYGTQAEKGIISTIKALGNTIDAKIRFVHYFMHEPEETETPRQVCIREEQSDKFLNYLECFLEDGDSDRCISEVGIDETKMNTCISNGKADEYYAEDSELSQSYGVGGSPTLVINNVMIVSRAENCPSGKECVVVNIGRDSASYLTGICEAFNNLPGECSLELSSSPPSPGFGWEGSSSGTTASCA
jgi:hypothetical protein